MTIGSQRAFYKKFKFVVEIDGFAVAAFTKAGPLQMDVAVVEQYEGGSLIPVKEPGRVKFPDVTLERGATDDRDMFEWMKQVADVASNSGLVTPAYKRTIDIVQMERDNTTKRRWRLVNAWPISFKAGDWDNGADENTVESVTLAIDSFDIVAAPA